MMNEQDRASWDFGPFALEQHYPDGMTVWITLIESTQETPISVIKDVKWSGQVVALPLSQLRRWGIWKLEYCPSVFTLGKYRLRIVDSAPVSNSVVCVRDNALWWRLPLQNWARRQGVLIHWRMLMTLKIWNLVAGIDTNKTLDEQRLKWFPAWRKSGKE